MRLAILSDIHGNLPALERALALVRVADVDRIIFLGDYVGYGGFDPRGVLDVMMRLAAEENAICLRGNHDQALIELISGKNRPQYDAMIDTARVGIACDSGQMREAHIAWLAGLPLTVDIDSILFAHGAIPHPEFFRYPTHDPRAADRWPWIHVYVDDIADELRFGGWRALVHGHSHQPQITLPHPIKRHHAKRIVPSRPSYEFPALGTAIIDVGSVGLIRTGGRPSFVILDSSKDGGRIQFVRFR